MAKPDDMPVLVETIEGMTPAANHARNAHRALASSMYGNSFNGIGYAGLISLLRDLMHLSDITGTDFHACLTVAEGEYKAERRSDAPSIGDPAYRAAFMARQFPATNMEKRQ